MADAPSLEHELDAPPWRRVEATLMATSRAIRRAYDKRLDPLDLNLSEASLLAYVAERGPVTQVMLAERLAMNRASTGVVIDSLSGRGLLTREPDPDDRRVWLVTISAEGRKLAASLAEVDMALREDLRTGINRSQRHQLAETLLKIQENLHALR